MSVKPEQTPARETRPTGLAEAAIPPLAEPLEEICRQAGEEARGLMLSGGLYCAPAVLAALNRLLGGGLDDGLVRRLTAGLPEGMGAGCTCGALSGAQVALGLFLGGHGYDKTMADSARALHDAFKSAHGSTCCRSLTRKVKGRREGKAHCAALTGHAAELACRLALLAQPGLAAGCPRQGEACRERPSHERASRAPVAALRRLLQKS